MSLEKEYVIMPKHCVSDTEGAQFHHGLIRYETDIEILKGKY